MLAGLAIAVMPKHRGRGVSEGWRERCAISRAAIDSRTSWYRSDRLTRRPSPLYPWKSMRFELGQTAHRPIPGSGYTGAWERPS